MAATWLWRGNDDELELLSPPAGAGAAQRAAAPERKFDEGVLVRNGKETSSWLAVRPGDALVVWTDDKQVDEQRFAGVWIVNPLSRAVSRMSERHCGRILQRAGLCGGSPLPSPRLYRVSIVHLEPVRIERIDYRDTMNLGPVGMERNDYRDRVNLGPVRMEQNDYRGTANLEPVGMEQNDYRDTVNLEPVGTEQNDYRDTVNLEPDRMEQNDYRDTINPGPVRMERNDYRDTINPGPVRMERNDYRDTVNLEPVETEQNDYRDTVNLEPDRMEKNDYRDTINPGPVRMERNDYRGMMNTGAQAGVAWSGEYGSGLWPEDAALRRVARTAAAALYALGLDIGEAEVALGGDGRTAVRAAWPRLRDAKLAAAELRRFAAWYAAACEEAKGRELLIGADPEFVFVTPAGKIAAASRFLSGGALAAAGSDAMLVGRRIMYPVAELRPRPAADPAALAANVRRLLLGAATRTGGRRLRWAAGAMPVPGLALGGHIHISGAPLTSRLLRLLDSCAAFPLALVEDPAGRERRPKYGTLGDYRLQSHGGFEYRTLPSWLVSPLAAKAAFAMALLCAREATALAYIPALDERYTAAYYAGDRAELAGCLDQVAEAIAATPSYAALARYIEPLLEAARRGETWDERSDIRRKWHIPMD
jgi:hypothetical protein